ncbi:MAG TPA: hypothetical protein VNH18_34185, partial [Bryobacteraceae bacterium]|nr:hypothetical protein [Bryobacteraceae bacterium]
MHFVGRSPHLGSEIYRKAARATQLIRITSLLRWAISCAAISALTACGQSSNSQVNGFVGPDTVVTKPVITLAAMKSTVAMGTPATLQWSAKYAETCTASGGWSGTQPTSGTVTTDPLMADTSYTLTCSGVGGSSSQSAEVVVTTPAPTVTLTASPAAVANGGMS